MQINVQFTGLEEARAKFKQLSDRRLNAAVATAMTRTAVQVRDKLKTALQTSIQNPTPYTQRQLRYTAATAARPDAAVGFDINAVQDVYGNVVRYAPALPGTTPAGRYMQPSITGGSRTAKRFEKALQAVGVLPAGWITAPGQRARIDSYGNQSPGELRQILSWFDAAELVAGSRQNMRQAGRAKRIKGTRKTAGFEYFVAPVGGRRTFTRASGKTGTQKMQPGIYRRTSYAMGNRIEPIIIFIKTATYRRRFDFYGIANREAARLIQPEFDRAIQSAIKQAGQA
jgi:hypothetical protein